MRKKGEGNKGWGVFVPEWDKELSLDREEVAVAHSKWWFIKVKREAPY